MRTENTSPIEPSRILYTEVEAHFSGIHAQVKLGSGRSPFSVMKIRVERAQGAPAHISRSEDKCFVITRGSFLFLIGSERRRAGAGDLVFIAKGEVHSFCGLDEEPSEMVLISTPSHHHEFFIQMSSLNTPHDPGEVQAICKRLDQEITGPVVAE